MSIFVDISNFSSNSGQHKFQYFDEFDRLIEGDKDFLKINSSHIKSFDNSFSVESSEGDISAQILKPEKACHSTSKQVKDTTFAESTKIKNFNIYNRCVFIIDNSSKLHSKSSNSEETKVCGNKELSNQSGIFNSISQNNLNANKRYDPRGLQHTKSLYHNERYGPKLIDHKLFYLHNDDLRPVLSVNIKSGIYKRVLNTDRCNVAETTRNSLYFLTNEKSGKILTVEQFDQLYNEDDADYIGKNAIFERGSCGTVWDVPLLTQGMLSEKRPGLEDNFHFLAHNILSLSKGNKIAINRKSNEIVYKESNLNKKTTYKIIYPDSLGLENTGTIKDNLTACNENVNSCKSSTQISLLSKSHNQIRHKKIARKRDEAEVPECISPITSRTRYGRVSKPPKYIQKIFKLPENEKNLCESTFARDYDNDYKYTGAKLSDFTSAPIQRTKRERNLPSSYRCPYCHKIYLGKRMQRHLEANPNHNIVLESQEEKESLTKLSLYKFLVRKLKQSPEENRAELFLAEITDLVDQLQSRGSRFVRNTSGVHLVNSQSSKVLGIPEGHYSIDVSAIESTPETDSTRNESESHIIPPPPRLDYNLSISLDDTISNAKLNLPDNIISSEESLLRTVNDLVEQGITTLREHEDVINRAQTSVIHYDHASDNAVEAVTIKPEQATPILDLSLDLFQFSSS